MTVFIRDSTNIKRVFMETLLQTPLYKQALSLGISEIYCWCVGKALFDVYLLDIWVQSFNSEDTRYLKFYDQVSSNLTLAIGDEFETTQTFINKRVGISHKDSDLVIFSLP